MKHRWRFLGIEKQANAVLAAYDRMGMRRRHDRLAECGSAAYVECCVEIGKYRVRSSKCGDPLCPACSRDKHNRIRSNVSVAIKNHKVRFVTLTMKQTDRPLSDQINRLHKCFRLLRKRRFFRQSVKNMFWVQEIKLAKTGRWNVHIHFIYAGTFMRQSDLSASWLEITGDSHIVDIRLADQRAAVELSKYISKAYDLRIFQPGNESRLEEFVTCSHRRRMMGVIGKTWREMRLTSVWVDPPDGPELVWSFVSRLDDLIKDYLAGDLESIKILQAALPRLAKELSG